MSNNTYGSGELYFDMFEPGTTNKQGRLYIASTPEFNLNVESETLEHMDPDHGIPEQDDSVVLETTRGGNFVTDDISSDNLALFFLGEKVNFTQGTTPVVDEVHTVLQGRYYQLGAAANGGMGVRNITGVVVTDDEVSPGTYVLNEDYVLDAEMGTLYIMTTAEGGSIPNDSVIEVDYTPTAETVTKVVSGSTTIEGELFFKSFNPKGTKRDVLLAKCQLSPNGDFALKGDSWLQIPFTLKVLKLNANTPAVQIQER